MLFLGETKDKKKEISFSDWWFLQKQKRKTNDLTNEAHNKAEREVNESFCSSPTKRKRNEHKLTEKKNR